MIQDIIEYVPFFFFNFYMHLFLALCSLLCVPHLRTPPSSVWTVVFVAKTPLTYNTKVSYDVCWHPKLPLLIIPSDRCVHVWQVTI